MTAPVVVKLGGALLDDADALDQISHEIARAHHADAPRVLVHGGGAAVDRALAAAGFTTQRHDGLRVTPREQIDLVVGVLAGTMNGRLCGAMQRAGANAVGVTTADGGSVRASVTNAALGCVGTAEPGDARFLTLLLAGGFLPVISSIGRTSDGAPLNINADDAACAIAALLDAREIELLTDVPGVLDATGTLLPELNPTLIEPLIDDGTIHGGMLPKVRGAIDVARDARCAVRIRSWRDLGSAGTRITVDADAVA